MALVSSVYTGRDVRELFLNDEMRDMRGPVAKLFSRVLIERLKEYLNRQLQSTDIL